MQKLAFNVEHVKDCQFHVLQTRSERPKDTEFLNFRYCLNVTLFKYLSINNLQLAPLHVKNETLAYREHSELLILLTLKAKMHGLGYYFR